MGNPPTSKVPQPLYDDCSILQKVKNKIQIVLYRGYIVFERYEKMESLMFFYHVTKEKEGIRMVYDASKSGLNSSLYAPWFALPTINTFACWMIVGIWCVDNNYSDVFLKSSLHPDLHKFCGVDLTELFPKLNSNDCQMLVAAWVCNDMGLSPLPYCSIQSGPLAKTIIIGNRKIESNPF